MQTGDVSKDPYKVKYSLDSNVEGAKMLRGILTFVGRGLAFNGYILSYFEGKIN